MSMMPGSMMLISISCRSVADWELELGVGAGVSTSLAIRSSLGVCRRGVPCGCPCGKGGNRWVGGPWGEGGRGRVAAHGPRAALPARQPGLVVRAGIATVGCMYIVGCHVLVHAAPMYRWSPILRFYRLYEAGWWGSRRGTERNVFFWRFVAQLFFVLGMAMP